MSEREPSVANAETQQIKDLNNHTMSGCVCCCAHLQACSLTYHMLPCTCTACVVLVLISACETQLTILSSSGRNIPCSKSCRNLTRLGNPWGSSTDSRSPPGISWPLPQTLNRNLARGIPWLPRVWCRVRVVCGWLWSIVGCSICGSCLMAGPCVWCSVSPCAANTLGLRDHL